MEYRRLGATGLKVAEFCLGCMTFGREANEAESRAIIDRYIDAGGNFLDTANTYAAHRSEEILGRVLKGRRDRLIVATKVRFHPDFILGKPIPPNEWGLSRRHILAEVEQSLRRLQTDYIDLYQVHCWDFETPIEETMRVLDDLVRWGKVRYIGASNFRAGQLMKSLWVADRQGGARFDCLQPQYSLLCRDIEVELLPVCRSEGLGVIPWSPLAGGFLSGKYRRKANAPSDSRLAQFDLWNRLSEDRNYAILETVEGIARARNCSVAEIALAWVKQQRGISSVIVGARTVDQLAGNLGAVGLTLDAAELEALDKVSATEPDYLDRFQSRVPGPRP